MDIKAFTETLFNRQNNLELNSASENHTLEYYKLCITAAEKISSHRQNANNFFLTINTVLISFVSYLKLEGVNVSWALLAISLSGVVTCLMWRRLILSYKELNSAKFKVILAIENTLPIRAYSAEWLALAEGKKPEVHKPFTSIESKIPMVFAGLHFWVLSMYLMPFMIKLTIE